jgi:hypothetical protein
MLSGTGCPAVRRRHFCFLLSPFPLFNTAAFRRYIPRSELEALQAEAQKPQPGNSTDKPAIPPGDDQLAA